MSTTDIDNRSFYERMKDPQDSHDRHVQSQYKADVERAGRTWASELERLRKKDKQQ